jgi:predicted PurR-regulated permease PerM
LLWKLSDVILLAVGAMLIATLLHVVAEPLERWTPLPAWSRLLVSGLVVIGLFGAAGWMLWSRMSAEFSEVIKRAVAATHQLQEQ